MFHLVHQHVHRNIKAEHVVVIGESNKAGDLVAVQPYDVMFIGEGGAVSILSLLDQ